jgi:hypothetical protein
MGEGVGTKEVQVHLTAIGKSTLVTACDAEPDDRYSTDNLAVLDQVDGFVQQDCWAVPRKELGTEGIG